MKKIFSKSQKFLAILTLILLLACTISPAVQAANSISRYGSRISSADGRRSSYTRVTGYDPRGVALNLVATASIGFGWTPPKAGKGEAIAQTSYYVTNNSAEHAYGIGNSIDMNTKWTDRKSVV